MVDDRGVAGRKFTATTTVAELADWWLMNEAATRVRPTSLKRYQARIERFRADLGAIAVRDLAAEQVTTWQARQLRSVSAGTVADARGILRQVMAKAVDLELVGRNVVDKVPAPKESRRNARALSGAETQRLLVACAGHRLGAAVACLFAQGWRVSEVLGLCWHDLELDGDEPTANVARACVYLEGVGSILGPPKTAGARGVHHLSPVVVQLLRTRRIAQIEERLAAGAFWETHVYESRTVEPVWTNATGGLVLRQNLATAVQRIATSASVDGSGLGTHGGRRSVVTVLYSEGKASIDDIARHVGHGSSATTANYVRNLGTRPRDTARLAATLLDPTVSTSTEQPKPVANKRKPKTPRKPATVVGEQLGML